MSDGKTRRYMNEREWQCFEDGVKYERERITALLYEWQLICKDDFTCFSCDEWHTYNENDGQFCKTMLLEIKGEK